MKPYARVSPRKSRATSSVGPATLMVWVSRVSVVPSRATAWYGLAKLAKLDGDTQLEVAKQLNSGEVDRVEVCPDCGGTEFWEQEGTCVACDPIEDDAEEDEGSDDPQMDAALNSLGEIIASDPDRKPARIARAENFLEDCR